MNKASQIIAAVTICGVTGLGATTAHAEKHVKARPTAVSIAKATPIKIAKTVSRMQRVVVIRHVAGTTGVARGASAEAIATMAHQAQIQQAAFHVSAPACGSMLMPAAALKQVSRGFSSYHAGIDLMAPYGSPIHAAAAGRVIFAGVWFGYGNMVDIQSDDGVVTRYGHLSAFAAATRPGHQVAAGDTIGMVGTSGLAHGPHVHFEVRIRGSAVDPAPFLALSSCRPGAAAPLVEEAQAPADVGRPGTLFQ